MTILIRYTKYSKDLHSKEKRKRHRNPFRKGGNPRRRRSKISDPLLLSAP